MTMHASSKAASVHRPSTLLIRIAFKLATGYNVHAAGMQLNVEEGTAAIQSLALSAVREVRLRYVCRLTQPHLQLLLSLLHRSQVG